MRPLTKSDPLVAQVEREAEMEALQFLRRHGLDPMTMTENSVCPPATLDHWRVRDEFIARFGFAILTAVIIETLRPFAPLLEIGAGCGYWAYELQQAGIDIVSTDPGTGRYGFMKNGDHWIQKWTDVKPFDATEAVRMYPTHALLIVWPDMAPWAADALRVFRHESVLYVGEGSGGCMADDTFHNLLEEEFEQERIVDLPVFWGLHDHLMIYRRKK